MNLIREIRHIDSDKIIIKIPKEFRKKRVEILLFPLEQSEQQEAGPGEAGKEQLTAGSGLCGLWRDERSPDEIIADIHSHRTGFGDRRVIL
jgi:hypothetical protein